MQSKALTSSSLEAGVWGLDAEGSDLAASWYPATWDTVGHDELVFLIPSLADSRGIDPTGRDLIAQLCSDRARRVAQLLKSEQSTRYVTQLRAQGMGIGPAEQDNRSDRGGPYCDWLASQVQAGSEEAVAAFELRFAEALARLCASAGGARTAAHHGVSIEDALLLAIHLRMNTAYFFDQHVWAHELLSAGAWLGHLLSGRSAIMPVSVAHAMVDWANGETSGCQRVLRLHAELAVGTDRLLRSAKRTIRRGRPEVIMPRIRPSTIGASVLHDLLQEAALVH